MESIVIEDPHGRYSMTIETDCVFFEEALRDHRAVTMFLLATHAVVSAILSGDPWLDELANHLSTYMTYMRDILAAGGLH